MSEGTLIFLAGALLALGLGASLIAGRLRVPGLVLFLGLGMLIGSDGLALVEFGASRDDVQLAQDIGIIALALILFEGGLATGWDNIKPVIKPSLGLALLGTLGTAVIAGLAATWFFDLDTKEGLLLGSIVAATDGAAVFSVLRGSSIPRRLARLLEGESGLNDPVAIVLVIGLIESIEDPSFGAVDIALLSLQELSIGAVIGVAVGWLAIQGFRRVQLQSTGLYPVGSVATAALAYGTADVLHGSGFMAVYLAGLMLGSGRLPARRTVADFHDGLAWVSQIAVFFTLGLLVFPSDFASIADEAILLAAVLMFVARPIAATVSTLGARFRWREKVLLGWAGMRGAIPIVLATFPVLEGIEQADPFFDIVFFVVLASTLFQGVTFEALATKLGLSGETPAVQRPLVEVGTIRRLGAEVVEYPVADDDAIVGRLVNELGLPREALVNVIVRGDQALLPRGSTTIEAGDRLHILVRQAVRDQVEGLFETWREGPIGHEEAPVMPVYGRASIFSVRPWREELGDPGAPTHIDGIAVARPLRVRRGRPGALVQLEDGRYAVTGDERVAMGGARQLFRYCRDRIRQADDPASVAWWQEVAGVLSQRVVR